MGGWIPLVDLISPLFSGKIMNSPCTFSNSLQIARIPKWLRAINVKGSNVINWMHSQLTFTCPTMDCFICSVHTNY